MWKQWTVALNHRQISKTLPVEYHVSLPLSHIHHPPAKLAVVKLYIQKLSLDVCMWPVDIALNYSIKKKRQRSTADNENLQFNSLVAHAHPNYSNCFLIQIFTDLYLNILASK